MKRPAQRRPSEESAARGARRRALVVAALLVAPLAPSSRAWAESPPVELRPLDRATVRVLAVTRVRPGAQRIGGRSRVVAAIDLARGSGVLVGDGALVLTSKRLVDGALAVAVTTAGGGAVVPARVLPVDADVVALAVPALKDAVPLPATPPTLKMGARVLTAAYASSRAESSPSAASGELLGVTPDGHVKVSLTVDGAGSGLFDEAGQLVGIVVGSDAGGSGTVSPLARVLPSIEREAVALRASRATFSAAERGAAALVADVDGGGPSVLEAGDPEARTWLDGASAETELLAAAIAWNRARALLVAHRADRLEELPPPDGRVARRLDALARRWLARLASAPPELLLRHPFIQQALDEGSKPAESEPPEEVVPPSAPRASTAPPLQVTFVVRALAGSAGWEAAHPVGGGALEWGIESPRLNKVHVALTLGLGSQLSSWHGGAVSLGEEVGLRVQVGEKAGLVLAAAWTPAVLHVNGDTDWTFAGYRLGVGGAAEQVGFGLAYQRLRAAALPTFDPLTAYFELRR